MTQLDLGWTLLRTKNSDSNIRSLTTKFCAYNHNISLILYHIIKDDHAER